MADRASRVFATDYLGDFCPDFGVPINTTHQIFKNIFLGKKRAGNTQLNTVFNTASDKRRIQIYIYSNFSTKKYTVQIYLDCFIWIVILSGVMLISQLELYCSGLFSLYLELC